MSKYIDLAGRIKNELIIPKAEILFGVECALMFLDDNPDQVPGRTITKSISRELFEALGDRLLTLADFEQVLHATTGTTVTPEPEPTNAEQLDRIYQAWRQDTDGMGLSVGEWMENHGVTAPGASDE